MSRTSLVVGIGNTLQGCDGFGPAVIEHLRADAELPDDVELLDAGTDLLSCLDQLADFDQTVLVDAFLGSGSGAVLMIDEAAFSTWCAESPSSHAFSVVQAVALFRRLHPRARTRFVLVGLDCRRISRDDALSPSVVEAGARAVLDACA